MADDCNHGLLIIGAGQSGVALAGSLRALGYREPITLLGEEDHRPYQRPALSKEFMQDKISKEKLIFRAPEYWKDHDIKVVKGHQIERVDKKSDGSGIAVSATGDTFPFRQLALTVGARARHIPLEGNDLDGVLYLRSADDALDLKARMPEAENLVVIGGGFIGLEAAASARGMGKTVTVLEAGPRLIGRAVGEETAEFFLTAHREQNTDVRLGVSLERFEGEAGRVTGVRLDNGEVVPADIVLVGIGVIPNTELAESMGLHCDNGIQVDEFALASDGHTVAIGDCANIPNPIPGAPDGERLRLESVNNAVEHAKVAAYSLAGRREEYQSIPWFWSNQGPYKLQIAGLSTGHDQTIVRRDGSDGKFSVLYYRAGRLIAADCVNSPVDFMDVKSALSKGLTISPEDAADVEKRLKESAVPSVDQELDQ